MIPARIHEKARRAVWQSGVILVLAVAAGLGVNHFRTAPLSLVADRSPEERLKGESDESLVVSLEEARDLCMEKNAVFLDARSPEDYARGHIRCAQNVPWQSFEAYIDRIWSGIPEEAWVVTYCDGEHCSLGEDLARELTAMGYRNVRVLKNGWTRWREAGLPVEEKGR
ncbi:MAG: rhodanese-like domain-containing protein [Desulfobacteraceae bacterium]